jgi:hypothetical protein
MSIFGWDEGLRFPTNTHSALLQDVKQITDKIDHLKMFEN